MVFGLFAKKVACFRCDTKVKEKQALFRRGLEFCSRDCVDAYVAEHPMTPPPDVPEAEYRTRARQELEYAMDEISAVVRGASTGLGLAAPDILRGTEAIHGLEEAQTRVARFNEHSLQALRFLYPLGESAIIEFLETVNLFDIGTMSPTMSGPLQNRTIRALSEPVATRLDAILRDFAT